jgi:hypothetical protein
MKCSLADHIVYQTRRRTQQGSDSAKQRSAGMHVRVQAVNAIENDSPSYHPLNLQMEQWKKGAARNFKVEGSCEVLIGCSEPRSRDCPAFRYSRPLHSTSAAGTRDWQSDLD